MSSSQLTGMDLPERGERYEARYHRVIDRSAGDGKVIATCIHAEEARAVVDALNSHQRGGLDADILWEAYYAKAKHDESGPDLNYADCEWIAAALGEAVR